MQYKAIFVCAVALTTIADNVVIGGTGDIVMAPIRHCGIVMLATLELQSVHVVACVLFVFEASIFKAETKATK